MSSEVAKRSLPASDLNEVNEVSAYAKGPGLGIASGSEPTPQPLSKGTPFRPILSKETT